jgi:NADPH:quinone reductase-like Zn-dependent oxidoreductase
MKAIVVKRHGDLSDVELASVPEPEIGSSEVLVEIKSAALNRLDIWVLEGWRGLQLNFPHILGCDGAGIIVQTGEEVNDYTIGDHVAINPTRSCGRCPYCLGGIDHMCDHFAVFGEHIPGFYAEYQAVPVRNLLKMPDDVSFDIAAAASLVYVTAWHSLIVAGGLRPGEDVLIVGAAGGVNSACIDIARLAGAGKIFVVGSSEKKLDVARQLGAHVTINRLQEDWGRALFKAADGKGVDIVIDNVGAETYQSSLRSLKKGGRLLTVGNSSGPTIQLDNRYIFGKHLSIIGSTMGPITEYNEVMKLVFSGRLTPAIDSVYPLKDGLKALHRLELGDNAGKLVLRM